MTFKSLSWESCEHFIDEYDKLLSKKLHQFITYLPLRYPQEPPGTPRSFRKPQETPGTPTRLRQPHTTPGTLRCYYLFQHLQDVSIYIGGNIFKYAAMFLKTGFLCIRICISLTLTELK